MYSIFVLFILPISNCARILGVFPSPFYSHQLVFRPLSRELARRGHNVVVITANPAFKDKSPTNLREIDVHDISYECRSKFPVRTGRINDLYNQMNQLFDLVGELIEAQLNTVEVQNLINDKNENFDLIIIEAVVRPALVFSHIFKAPVITISSLGSLGLYTKYLGVPNHPVLYPNSIHQRLYNLKFWEKAKKVYNHYLLEQLIESKEAKENDMLKRNFGSEVPLLSELKNNVEVLILSTHHLWEDNRPVPPNVVYLGGLHLETNDTRILSTELKLYLDSSIHGVIYVSLGSHIMPSLLDNMKIVIQAFSKLPYDVLLKWDHDDLPGCPSNVRITQWAPQQQVLQHPNIKLFITQGGLQSTEESIVAGVPVIGIPVLGDQWYNVEKYVHFKIGLRIDLESVTEDKMLDAITTVIDDKSYKRNINALRGKLYDRPQSSLAQAVWWTEYVIRNGRSAHLKSSAAHMSLWDYAVIDLLLVSALCFTSLLFAAAYGGFKVFGAVSYIIKHSLTILNSPRIQN